MLNTNTISAYSHALAPRSPIPTPLIENSAETLPEVSSLETLKERDFKRLTLLLALNGLSGKTRLAEEKRLLKEEKSLSKTDLPPRHLHIPTEIVDKIFYHTLLNLEPHDIFRVTQSNKRLTTATVKWLTLYQKFDWLYPERVPTLSEFTSLLKDARTYGQKTFAQIFAGFHLLKRIKDNQNALEQMTIADLQKAGIYTNIWEIYSRENAENAENAERARAIAEPHFLLWVQENPVCILICLRWVPAQNGAPYLLAEAAKHGDLAVVKTIFALINEHHITYSHIDSTLSSEEKKHLHLSRALENAIKGAHILIANYLVKTVGANIRRLPENILHQAIGQNPSFEMVKWLVKEGLPLHHIGSDRFNRHYYEKTAVDVALSSPALWNFTSLPPAFRKRKMELLHIALYLIDQGVQFNPQNQPKGMTLLYAICYAEDADLGLKVARLLIAQDPNYLHIRTQDKNAYTPLYLAYKERKYRLMALLLEHGADATVRVQGNTVIELVHQLVDLEVLPILQKTGNTGLVSKDNFNWVHPEWVSTREEFAALVEDACTFGQRNFEQVFEGLNILRLIKLAGPQAPITFEHLQRAGIMQEGDIYPDDPEARQRVQNEGISWVRENPAHMLACLRWIPVQQDIPDVLVEAVKSKKVALVESVLGFMRKHAAITPLSIEKAFEQAIKNGDIPIAQYLLHAAHSHLPFPNSLHMAAEMGSIKVIELLINQGMLLYKKGISQANPNSYLGKTAAEVAVSTITASHFAPRAPQALRDHGVNLLDTACYLLKAGQAQRIPFDPACTPTGTTLLHAACYVSSEQKRRWLAQFAFDQNPAGIHAVDNQGRTPLDRAIEQKHADLVDFLLNKGAQTMSTFWNYAALKYNDPQIYDLLAKKKAVSLHLIDPSLFPTLNLTHTFNRIRNLLINILWPEWNLFGNFMRSILLFFKGILPTSKGNS